MGKDEVKKFLKDYCVGNSFTRGAWADGLIDAADTNGDGMLSSSEIASGYGALAGS
ncbi:MAG: hypothetical protein KDD66_14980 [Bdellovibrionales bacterium]|nr:hypothetical protein [Bdellovibrionales bacterium]